MRNSNRILGLLMALVLMITATGGIKAKAATRLEAIEPELLNIDVEPGKTTHVSIPVRSASASIRLFNIKGVATDTAASKLIHIRNTKLSVTSTGKTIDMSAGYIIYTTGMVSVEFDVIADESLKMGYYTVDLIGIGNDYASDDYLAKTEATLLQLNIHNLHELNSAYLSVSNVSYKKDKMRPGNTVDMEFTVKNDGDIEALNAFMKIELPSDSLIPVNSGTRYNIGNLEPGKFARVTVPVKVLDTAEPKENVPIGISFECKDNTGADKGPFAQTEYITIKPKDSVAENKPLLELSTTSNYEGLPRGSKLVIPITIKNSGSADAKDITLEITSGVGTGTGVTKDFTSAVLKAGKLAVGEKTTIKVPVTVSEAVEAGLHEFVFTVKYKDKDDKAMEAQTLTMYMQAPELTPTPTPKPTPALYNYLDIHDVSQSPSNPVHGGKVSLTFTITNNGNGPISNLRIYGTELSSNGFEPISNEPYQTVGDLDIGKSKKVSMIFRLGEDIPNGLNLLNIGYEFFDENGEKKKDSAGVYVLNCVGVKKDEPTPTPADLGRPKLIVSDYSTDKDILRAGETFDFSFSIKNTHQTKAAKNIKITLSQAESIFAPAEGTNIFYIDAIEPGEIDIKTITLKTKNDATTGDYAINITMEYEYDDMSQVDREKGGVSEESSIKLRATENYRPVIENVSIESWEGVYVDTPVDLSFEFYNMGKSTLGNVYVTVEGDFALANNSSMSYVGAVNGYSQEFINPSVVALVPGEATGILTVHFEDSNGDEVTISQEFTEYVQEYGGGGFDFPEEGDWGGDFPIDDGGMGEEKTGLLSKIKPWMWIVLVIVVAAAITVPIVVHKSKKAKKAKVDEDEDY
ncbi:MAG: hypothetical protein K6G81_00680 [Lachnospiraceae bacterium]|nr:hypothetical protein [Lachnospiraceae bacterium]